MSIIEIIKSEKKILFYIFITALLLRVIYLITINIVIDKHILNQDFEYGVIAKSLLAGKGYSVPLIEQSEYDGSIKELNIYRPTAYHLPFYPIMLATVYYFVKNPLSMLIVMFIQAVIASAICIIIYLVVFKLFANRRTAVIAGCAMMLYPTFIIYVSRLVPETMLIFSLSMALLSLLVLRDTPTYKTTLITGILLGITLLISNVIVPVLPCIIIWLAISLDNSREKRCKIVFLLITVIFVIVSPVLIRNYIVFSKFPLMKTTAGTNLWLGNNPQASGTFFLDSHKMLKTILPKAFSEGQKLSETEQDKILYDDAMAYIKKNPMHFIRLFLKKLYYFTWFPPDNLITKEARLHKYIVLIPYGSMLISFFIGIFLSFRKYPKDLFLICSIIFSVALLHSVFIVGHPRYRMAVEPYIIIISSYTVNWLIDKYTLRGKRDKKQYSSAQ
jgi:4-amino-4-deoxy-L-arabinose transferase-like glycosyltransferase